VTQLWEPAANGPFPLPRNDQEAILTVYDGRQMPCLPRAVVGHVAHLTENLGYALIRHLITEQSANGVSVIGCDHQPAPLPQCVDELPEIGRAESVCNFGLQDRRPTVGVSALVEPLVGPPQP